MAMISRASVGDSLFLHKKFQECRKKGDTEH